MVYFPPQVTLSQLLSDGTDVLHSPGDPFNRRLWAGGKVRFPILSGPLLDGSRAVCLETIRDVTVNGLKGEEKIVVSIERRVGVLKERDEEEHDIRRRIWTENEEENGQASVIETRNLIFMREKTQEQLENDKKNFGENNRIIKRAHFFDSYSKLNDTDTTPTQSSLGCTVPLWDKTKQVLALSVFSSHIQCPSDSSRQNLYPTHGRLPEPSCTWSINSDVAAYSNARASTISAFHKGH